MPTVPRIVERKRCIPSSHHKNQCIKRNLPALVMCTTRPQCTRPTTRKTSISITFKTFSSHQITSRLKKAHVNHFYSRLGLVREKTTKGENRHDRTNLLIYLSPLNRLDFCPAFSSRQSKCGCLCAWVGGGAKGCQKQRKHSFELGTYPLKYLDTASIVSIDMFCFVEICLFISCFHE